VPGEVAVDVIWSRVSAVASYDPELTGVCAASCSSCVRFVGRLLDAILPGDPSGATAAWAGELGGVTYEGPAPLFGASIAVAKAGLTRTACLSGLGPVVL
jgi:hypothetical protein